MRIPRTGSHERRGQTRRPGVPAPVPPVRVVAVALNTGLFAALLAAGQASS
jgi:hypothetical protein